MKRFCFLVIMMMIGGMTIQVNAQYCMGVPNGFKNPSCAPIYSKQSLGGNHYNSVYRKWWQIVLADAAGALGGVASGMQICKHWLCAAFGGVIGAAGASVSVARSMNAEIRKPGSEIPVSFRNQFEIVGRWHNELIGEFYKAYSEFDQEKLYDFLLQNRERYGIDEIPVSKEIYKGIVNASSLEFINLEEALKFLDKILPPGIDSKKEFLIAVEKLLSMPDVAEFNANALDIEEEFFRGKVLPEREQMLYESFFSTMRYSANFWHPSPTLMGAR